MHGSKNSIERQLLQQVIHAVCLNVALFCGCETQGRTETLPLGALCDRYQGRPDEDGTERQWEPRGLLELIQYKLPARSFIAGCIKEAYHRQAAVDQLRRRAVKFQSICRAAC